MTKKEPDFFVIWNPGHGAPTKRHTTEKTARIEAARLARLNPGQEFIVLRSVAACTVADVQWTEFDDMPF